MEQFNLDIWLQDKSRKVVTREGKDVEIIYTNSPVPHHPIVGFIDKSIYTWTIDGKLIYGKEEQDKNDLFFADEKGSMNEFETRIYNLINFSDPYNYPSIKEVKEEAGILLDLARNEILKDLPKWKKITDETNLSLTHSNGEYYLPLEDLEKLPKEE